MSGYSCSCSDEGNPGHQFCDIPIPENQPMGRDSWLLRAWRKLFPPCTCKIVALDVHCTLYHWDQECPKHSKAPPHGAVDPAALNFRYEETQARCRRIKDQEAEDERAIEMTYWGGGR